MEPPYKYKTIPIYIPEEYMELLNEVILVGLKHTKIDREQRKSFKTWWEADYTFAMESNEKQ